MKENGFTLIELIVVIAIVAVLALFVSGGVLGIFKKQKTELNSIQINQILDAAKLYKADCENSTPSMLNSLEITCSSPDFVSDESGNVEVTLDALVKFKYIEKPKVEGECSGKLTYSGKKWNTDGITCN